MRFRRRDLTAPELAARMPVPPPARHYDGAEHLAEVGPHIRASTTVDIDLVDGRVVGVWFRCHPLPFTTRDLEIEPHLPDPFDMPKLVGIELAD